MNSAIDGKFEELLHKKGGEKGAKAMHNRGLKLLAGQLCEVCICSYVWSTV